MKGECEYDRIVWREDTKMEEEEEEDEELSAEREIENKRANKWRNSDDQRRQLEWKNGWNN